MRVRLGLIFHGWALKLAPGIVLVVEAHIQARIAAAIEAAIAEYDERLLAAHRAHAARTASSN